MITSPSKHAPERHTGPSHGLGIASLCLATQRAESRSLTTSCGLSGQSGSMPAPGRFAIAGRKAIARLIEGVLRSLRSLLDNLESRVWMTGSQERNGGVGLLFGQFVTVDFCVAEKIAARIQKGLIKALTFAAEIAGVVRVGFLNDVRGHFVALFCFLTYGNVYPYASTNCLNLGNFVSIEVRG